MAHIKAQTSGKSSIRRLSKKQRIQNWRNNEADQAKAKDVQAAARLNKTRSKLS